MIDSNMSSRNFFNRWIIGLSNVKKFAKINSIFGNNPVEPKVVKSNYFGADLDKLSEL